MRQTGKTLVTGATGFTGKALCRRLIQQGEQVLAFVRPKSDIRELEAIGAECRIVDIKNGTEVKDNFTNVSKVFHIAAAYRTEYSDQGEFRRVNVEATRNLLEAACGASVNRFIHCSTVGVQGEIEDPPASEEYRFKPGDHYQASKLEGELLARKYFADGLPGVVVRPVGIYGPGDIRFLKLFRTINQGVFVMIGSGNVLYHLTYISDLVEGIFLCGTVEDALGEVFTIGGEEYTTIRELVNMIADVLGKPIPRMRIPYLPVYAASVACEIICRPLRIAPPIYPRRVEFFSKSRAFSIDKAKRILGYTPRMGLREGLAATAAWYKENGLL
jgi:nucleoside-diphosphate-sugar epimerase